MQHKKIVAVIVLVVIVAIAYYAYSKSSGSSVFYQDSQWSSCMDFMQFLQQNPGAYLNISGSSKTNASTPADVMVGSVRKATVYLRARDQASSSFSAGRAGILASSCADGSAISPAVLTIVQNTPNSQSQVDVTVSMMT